MAIADMSRRERVTTTTKSVTTEGMASRNMPVGRPGTLLLAMYASVGELAFLDIEATWNQAILGITPDLRRFEPRFLRYALLDRRDDFLRAVRTNTQANLNASQVGDLWLQKPTLAEQYAIADYLDRETAKIDMLIEEQERLIETLRERRSGVIAQAVTRGLDGTPLSASNDDWIGAAPTHWLRGQVKHSGRVTLGKMLQSAANEGDLCAPYMRAANVQPDGVLQTEDVKKMWFNDTELETLSLQRGDVVVVEGGIGGYGRAAYLDHELAGWGFQNSINRIRPHADTDGRYLTYFLIMARAKGLIEAYCNVVSMPHFTAEKLNAMPILLPPFDEQRRIADYLDEQASRIDALIAETERFIELSKERRTALIAAAVTGQIDLRNDRGAA